MIGKRDKAILGVLWERGPQTVREIAATMIETNAEPEVQNEDALAELLRSRVKRMVEEGLVREAAGRRVIAVTVRKYEALVSPNGVRRECAPS